MRETGSKNGQFFSMYKLMHSVHSANLCSGLQWMHLFCNRVRYGRSWSSKVDDFGNNRKRVCDFLLVRHCDYGPILHSF